MTNYNDMLYRIGVNVREARKKKGLSQAALATRCSSTIQSNISLLENGKRNATLLTLLDIAEALNIEPYKLLK